VKEIEEEKEFMKGQYKYPLLHFLDSQDYFGETCIQSIKRLEGSYGKNQ
jgi:hypothetical protein